MISNENWEFLNTVVDPNQQWFEWKTKFLRIFDKHAPILTKRVRSKHSPPNVRNACTIVTFLRSKQLNQMIHITGRILSQCETKLMLKLNLLNSRITKTNFLRLIAILVKRGRCNELNYFPKN